MLCLQKYIAHIEHSEKHKILSTFQVKKTSETEDRKRIQSMQSNCISA